MTTRHFTALAALTLTVGILSAATASDSRSTLSSCTSVLDSEVCTWVEMEGDRTVLLGATIPLALIEDVPLDAPMVWPPEELAAVPFPAEARESTGIDHLGINWEAHGHPPASFLTDHFDFHFYNVSETQVRAIDCANESKPAELPDPYALPDIEVPDMGVFVGLCVPRMGMHAMPEAEVDDTEPFEASMMIGYYAGEPIFFEPMVSRDLLLRRSDFSVEMPDVDGLPAGVRYPSAFRAEYDPAEEQYRLTFSGFETE